MRGLQKKGKSQAFRFGSVYKIKGYIGMSEKKEISGEFRVFGPPGTGKTYYLTKQTESALRKYTPSELLIVSFTKAAAHEIATRTAAPGMDKRVGTLHSFCFRALGQPELAETPARIKEWNEHIKTKVPTLMIKEKGEGDDPVGQTISGKPMAAYHLLRSRMVPREQWPEQARTAATAWEEWKEGNDWLDFTDLIEQALEDVAAAPGHPAVGFFDEVQAFSTLELDLVRKWGQHMRQTVMAGDDDQSIYGFRGATPDAFLEPDIPEDRKKFLRESYRLPSVVKDYADRWISRVRTRQPKEYKPRREGGSVKLARNMGYRRPERVLAAICRDLDKGRDVMVLSSCAYMLSPLLSILRSEGIPFHNPYRRKNGKWNPIHPHKGAALRLSNYLRPDPGTWEDPRLWTWGELWRWVEILNAKTTGMPKGSKSLIKKIAKNDKAAQEIINLDLIASLLTGEDMEKAQRLVDKIEGGGVDFFRDHVLDSHHNGALEMALAVQHRQGGRALREPPRLCVGTIHSVKGGAADSVYLFPDLSLEGERQGQHDPDSLTRLFYVGMTRAREKVTLCEAETRRAIRWIH